MTFSTVLLLGLVVITIFGGVIKTLVGVAGLPNFVPLIRDPLIFAVFIYGISKLDMFASRKWPLLIAAMCSFAGSYLFASMIEDSALTGLYYLRIYLLPFFFFVGALGILSSQPPADARQALIRFLAYWNVILFTIAVGIYVLLQFIPSLRSWLFFGTGLLPTAWYISGGTWMRMGLPAAGPNTLGLIFALHAMVFISILLTRQTLLRPIGVTNRTLLFGVLIALLGLMLTFSRSSMLLLIIGAPLLLLMPGVMTFSRFFKIAMTGFALLAVLLIIGYIVDNTSNGYVTRWLVLNTNFRDPSMLGHFRSIEFAVEKFHEYALWGYPRGTVGPKAIMFSGIANNVENSLLAVLYDMGLFIGSMYGLAIGVLYATGYQNRLQLILLAGFSLPCLFLPYVFEADALIYFSFIYLLLGLLTSTVAAPAKDAKPYVLHFA